MSENFQDVVDFVMGNDNSELARTKAELAYALHSLERELSIAQSMQTQNAALVEVLKLARARIEYLGAVCTDPRHFQSNFDDFFPKIDGVLAAVGGSRHD